MIWLGYISNSYSNASMFLSHFLFCLDILQQRVSFSTRVQGELEPLKEDQEEVPVLQEIKLHRAGW